MTAADALAACTLLLVDDEEANLDLLQSILEEDGFSTVVRTADARHAIPLLESVRPDLVLLDLHMPYRSGFEVLADLRERTPIDEHLPVLVLTADATFRAKQQALAGGATDFVTKPFHNAEVLLRVRNLLRTRLLYQEQRRARHAAELLDEASRVLQDSLDGATAAGRLAHLIVPRLADACAVDLEDGDGGLVRAGHALAAFTDTGAERDMAEADDTRALFDAREPAHVLVVPLDAGGDAVGQLALGRYDASQPFGAADARLAEELARRLARAVAHARLFREARAAAEARDQVLAVVAHDLRSPLCALRLDAELLDEKLSPTSPLPLVGRALARMRDTTARMDGLIADLLDLSRLDRGPLALELAVRDVAACVSDAAETLRSYVASHDLTLDVVPAPGPLCAPVDESRLSQVVSNLVGNAVKFTPAGGRVTVGCTRDGGEIRITVADTGVGIAPEQLPHVFGAFWQARHADRRGLGLGLAIARGIVEAHGGRIWVESRVAHGTTFTCTLPVVHPAPFPPVS